MTMDSQGKSAKKKPRNPKVKKYSSEAKEIQSSDLDHVKTNQISSLLSNSEAKDKTQVAATTSMAVIHIGILKALLDIGRHGLVYYDWCLGFVIAALVLQFLSGMVAIYIATIKSFLSNFNRDFGYYCLKSCCPCMLHHGRGVPDFEEQETGGSSIDGESQQLVGPSSSSEITCCGCCTDELEYDEMVLLENEAWMKKSFSMHEEAANADQELKWMEEYIEELEKEKDELLNEGLDMDDPRVTGIGERLQEKEREHDQIVEKQRLWKKFKKKGAIRREHLQAVMDEKVMKKAACWQCVLSVLTYIIFTLNAVITGFGLANLGGQNMGANETKA